MMGCFIEALWRGRSKRRTVIRARETFAIRFRRACEFGCISATNNKRRRPKKGNAGKKMGKVGKNSTLLSRSHSIIYDAFVASVGITAQQREGIGHCRFGVRTIAIVGVDDEEQTSSFE